MALSDTKLRYIHVKPYSGPAEISDADGLGVRISPKSVILFQHRYKWNGKPQRLSLSRYPTLALKDARNLVSELRVMYDSGTDPRRYTEKTTGEQSMAVGDCLTYWKEQYVDVALRPKT